MARDWRAQTVHPLCPTSITPLYRPYDGVRYITSSHTVKSVKKVALKAPFKPIPARAPKSPTHSGLRYFSLQRIEDTICREVNLDALPESYPVPSESQTRLNRAIKHQRATFELEVYDIGSDAMASIVDNTGFSQQKRKKALEFLAQLNTFLPNRVLVWSMNPSDYKLRKPPPFRGPRRVAHAMVATSIPRSDRRPLVGSFADSALDTFFDDQLAPDSPIGRP